GPAIGAVLAFVGAGAGERGETLNRLAGVIGGSAEGDAGLEELARIDAALTGMGVGQDRARFDPAVVRGLEYYTGPVYEAELVAPRGEGRVSLGSIGGGGRYDDLVARITGERTPATGFSFGVSRLAYALRQLDLIEGQDAATVRGPVVVIVFSETDMPAYLAAAAELRAAGVAAEVYLGRAGMRAQMKYADRRQSPAAVILGGDELAAGTVTVKDLDLGRALSAGVADNETWKTQRPGQVTAPRGELVATV